MPLPPAGLTEVRSEAQYARLLPCGEPSGVDWKRERVLIYHDKGADGVELRWVASQGHTKTLLGLRRLHSCSRDRRNVPAVVIIVIPRSAPAQVVVKNCDTGPAPC